jgi:hypothetical protein
MRYIIVHQTNAEWESGVVKPNPDIIAKVGGMIADMQKANAMVDGDGLGPSMRGVRLNCERGECKVTKGPYNASAFELAAGFATVVVESLDDAITWAKKLASDLGDVEIDIRPCNEPWDIGVAPKPEGLKTTRYMLLHKATAETEQGKAKDTSKSIGEMKAAGVLQKRVELQPTSKGARVRRNKGVFEVRDGPFAEAKEMVGGYVVLDVKSKQDALDWAKRYVECVDVDGVDVLEVR